jgi:hypothetical protein
MKTQIHPMVVLGAPRDDVPTLTARGNLIHNAMAAAASTFVTPVPSMPALASLIQALDAAQQAAMTRAKGLAATRNLKASDLADALDSERAYVQSLVNAAPEQASHLAELAGMSIRTRRAFTKPVLALSLDPATASVHARAYAAALKAGRGKSRSTTYNWRISADGGKTWVLAPSTPLARTTFPGLAPLTTYGVEVCITDVSGTTAWSQMVTILVH